MARITIDDLPALEDIPREKLEAIFGAGRPSFRPMIDTLEDRSLLSVSVLGVSAPSFSPTNSSGILDTTAINIQHSGTGTDAGIKVLIESGNNVIRVLTPPNSSLGGSNTESVTWDGMNASGVYVGDGSYNVVAQYNANASTGPLKTSSSKIAVVDDAAPNSPTNLMLSTGKIVTNNNKPTVTGKAEASSTINLYDGSTPVGHAVASPTGTFSIASAIALGDGPTIRPLSRSPRSQTQRKVAAVARSGLRGVGVI